MYVQQSAVCLTPAMVMAESPVKPISPAGLMIWLTESASNSSTAAAAAMTIALIQRKIVKKCVWNKKVNFNITLKLQG